MEGGGLWGESSLEAYCHCYWPSQLTASFDRLSLLGFEQEDSVFRRAIWGVRCL